MFSTALAMARSAAMSRRVTQLLDSRADLTLANVERYAVQLGIDSSARVVDLGCGTGRGSLALARVVGVAGVVLGIDADRALLDLARARPALPQMRWKHADASCSGEREAAWDVCWIDRVLAHCAAPEQVLAEAVRLLRAGGRLFSCEIDYAGISVQPCSVAIDDALCTYRLAIDTPTISQRLPVLVQAAFPGARIHRARYTWSLSTRREVMQALALPLWLRMQPLADPRCAASLREAARELAALTRARCLNVQVPVQWTLVWTARGG